jgi:transcriptional regulator with XRE-family HTH domain
MPSGVLVSRTKGVTQRPAWAQAIYLRRIHIGKSQEQVALDARDLSQRTVSDVEQGKTSPLDLTTQRVIALARGLNWSPREMQEATGLNLGFSAGLAGVPASVLKRGDREVEDFLTEPQHDLVEVPYYRTGAGPAIEEDQPAGTIRVSRDQQAKYPRAMYVRVDGDCMVPLYPVGWFAVVIPDLALWHPGADALVWLAGNGRKLCKVIETREDGDHWCWQPNPAPGEDRHFLAPVGSRVLGVAIDCVRGGPHRLTSRELADLLRERPEND